MKTKTIKDRAAEFAKKEDDLQKRWVGKGFDEVDKRRIHYSYYHGFLDAVNEIEKRLHGIENVWQMFDIIKEIKQ
jgi:uncharacterized protein YukE